MYYKISSKAPSHIWDYVAFNQLAEGSIVNYEMKTEFAVDYAVYKYDGEINQGLLDKFGFICSKMD